MFLRSTATLIYCLLTHVYRVCVNQGCVLIKSVFVNPVGESRACMWIVCLNRVGLYRVCVCACACVCVCACVINNCFGVGHLSPGWRQQDRNNLMGLNVTVGTSQSNTHTPHLQLKDLNSATSKQPTVMSYWPLDTKTMVFPQHTHIRFSLSNRSLCVCVYCWTVCACTMQKCSCFLCE